MAPTDSIRPPVEGTLAQWNFVDMGPVPQRPESHGLVRRAAGAAVGVLSQALRDDEVRGRAIRWVARKAFG